MRMGQVIAEALDRPGEGQRYGVQSSNLLLFGARALCPGLETSRASDLFDALTIQGCIVSWWCAQAGSPTRTSCGSPAR